MMRATLSDDERGAVGAERVDAWMLVLLAVGFTVAVVLQPGVIAASPPDASFSGTFAADTNTLQVEHDGGDAIRSGPTSSLVLVVSDAETDSARNVTWVADDGSSLAAYPVEPGDGVAIDDPTVDSDGDGDAFDGDAPVGFELGPGDTVRVVWLGRPLGAPDQVTTTLDRVTIQDGT
jgi:hypothetical protein